MALYFRKEKYQTSMITKATYNKWIEENPQFSKVPYSKWKRYWKYLREEVYQAVIENPDGVDLPLFMGNISVKILDIEFKCAKDFNTSILTNKETGKKEKLPFITSDIPKKPKIVWKKHKLFTSLPSIFGTEMARTCKKVISAGIRNNLFKYSKAFGHDKVKSKCEEIIPVMSLFDQA
jgi:hypothetical protein